MPDTDPSRRVVPVLSTRSDEPRRHPGLGGGAKRVSGVCRHHVLIEKGLVHPPPTLSLPFLRPPIPCWLGGCSSRVAYSKITAARNFLYSAPIGICRCASSPIGPEIRPRNWGCAPTCALTSSFWHQLSPHPAVGRISLAQCTGTLPMLWDNTPGSLGCPPVPTQDSALSRWSPTLSKRPVLMRRGTLKGPIPIKMSLCLLQLSVLSSGALHTPQSLLQPSTASITAGTLLCRLTCPLPTLNLRGTSVPVGRVTAPPGPGFLGTARAVRTGTKSSSPASFR